MSTSPNASTSDTTNITLHLFNLSTTIKLTKSSCTNYPIWEATILSYLKGQKVFGYAEGTIIKPSKEITVNDGSRSINPSYETWETQDNLIVNCLNSSLSEEVSAQVAHWTSSHNVWIALSSTFASQSRAKAVQVCSQLATARIRNPTANEYFMNIKKLMDDLAVAGQAMKCNDIITYLLAGLGPE